MHTVDEPAHRMEKFLKVVRSSRAVTTCRLIVSSRLRITNTRFVAYTFLDNGRFYLS